MVVIAVAACDLDRDIPATGLQTVGGRIILFAPDLEAPSAAGEACTGGGAFSDISAGMEVSVRDTSDAELALAQLAEGQPLENDACAFAFTIHELPHTSIYIFELGSAGRRGGPAFSFQEMIDMNWQVEIEFGERPPGLANWTPPPL